MRALMRFGVLLLLLFAWLAFGCAEPLPIRAYDLRDAEQAGEVLDELPPEVDEACDLLAIACEAVDWSWGVVVLELVPVPAEVRIKGHTIDTPCRPIIRAAPRADVIAHELGHALEAGSVVGSNAAGHLELDGNLMSHDVSGTHLIDSQQEAVWDAAGLLVACR